MTDHELLELAAQAAGITGFWVDAGLNTGSNAEPRIWNPLIDDGDALRLSIKLQIYLIHHHHGIGWVDAGYIKELTAGDPYAATRRAIVRAAASMTVAH
jgi:hypothetical protein